MAKHKMILTADDKEAITLALKMPGWANTLELIGDGVEAIKVIRDVDVSVNPEVQLSKYAHEAVKAAMSHAVQRGFFGPGEPLVKLLTQIGMEVGRKVKVADDESVERLIAAGTDVTVSSDRPDVGPWQDTFKVEWYDIANPGDKKRAGGDEASWIMDASATYRIAITPDKLPFSGKLRIG